MADFDSKKVERVLIKKGFRHEARNKKHRFLFFYFNGLKTSIRTMLSHGKDSIDDSLIGMMSRQVKLSNQEFRLLVKCTLSEENYKKILKEKGLV